MFWFPRTLNFFKNLYVLPIWLIPKLDMSVCTEMRVFNEPLWLYKPPKHKELRSNMEIGNDIKLTWFHEGAHKNSNYNYAALWTSIITLNSQFFQEWSIQHILDVLDLPLQSPNHLFYKIFFKVIVHKYVDKLDGLHGLLVQNDLDNSIN